MRYVILLLPLLGTPAWADDLPLPPTPAFPSTSPNAADIAKKAGDEMKDMNSMNDQAREAYQTRDKKGK